MTDRRVIFAANRASDRGQRWYTSRQLFGELVRKRALRWSWLRNVRQRQFDAVPEAVERLRRSGWSFPGLIVKPTLDGWPAPGYPEPDLFDYGAERILVVDDVILVDLLVRTGVHTDARAMIISATGYPSSAVERAAALVRGRPTVPVHTLHASQQDPGAIASATRVLLAAPDLTPTDVGLSSRVAHNIAAIRWARRLSSVPVDSLPYRWLTKGLVEALATGRSLEQLTQDEETGGVGDFG